MMSSTSVSQEPGGPRLTSQMEDYLEVIAHLQTEDHVARAKDIADRMNVTRATVTSALRALGERGLINYQPYSHITLTETGKKLADEIIRRHEILTEFFRKALQMPPTQAEDNACRAEHVLDSGVIERMVDFLEFLKKCPRTGDVWHKAFDRYCSGESGPSRCKECIGACLAKLYAEEGKTP